MDAFLSLTNEKLKNNQYSALSIVLGNESCDLDSAVCALAYATFLYWQHEQIKCKPCTRLHRDESTYKDEIFIPILNVKREDFVLKTEIVYCMDKAGVDASKFIFRDDYNFEELMSQTKTSVTLVDHHILGKNDLIFKPHVTEIIDHRPTDHKSWTYTDEVRSTMEIVGSACSLVTERIINLAHLLNKNDKFFIEYPVLVELLHSTIILDTVNFSKDVDKGTPKDMEMLLYLETFIASDNHEENRKTKLQVLSNARTDVSKLTAAQLLRKDVKIVGNVLMPSFPILVEQFLNRPDVHAAVDEALRVNECAAAILLGMNLSGSEVERDLAVWCNDRDLFNSISQALLSWSTPSLQLEVASAHDCYALYKQLNKKASRKQILPIVQKYLAGV